MLQNANRDDNLINNNLACRLQTKQASLPRKLIYARNHEGNTNQSCPVKKARAKRFRILNRPSSYAYADSRIRDLDHSNDAHLCTMQASGSPCCQAPGTRSQNHAHEVIISRGMEAHSEDTNNKHHAVKIGSNSQSTYAMDVVSSGGKPRLDFFPLLSCIG